MELMIYRLALFLTAIINLIMAGMLWNGSKAYKKYAIYYRTRLLTTLWIAVFGLGYLIHGTFMWRFSWPTAASALTVSYFHIGAICFSWGYTSLLNPNYLTRRIVWRDGLIFLFALIVYWMVAALWHEAPGFTLLSFVIFFAYAAWIVFKFYHTYNMVSSRMLRLSFGNVMGFVRWIAITSIFPTDFWPFTLLLFAGVGMFAYIAYSLNKYGITIETTTEATENVALKYRRK